MSYKYKEVQLGTVCTFGDGAHTKVNRVEVGVPYLTSKNIKNGYVELENVDFISYEDYEKLFGISQKSVRHLQEGDVLIGIIGTFGNCYLYKSTDRFGISSSIGIARPNKELLDSKYLYYYLSSNRFEKYTEMYKGGSVQGYTNLPTLRKIPIYLPPLEKQEKIANILSSLDDKIELNNEMNKTLEEMAQSIFKRWFVDFEFPNEDGEPYKSSGGEMVDSELGMIPKGWEVVNYINTSDIQYGFAFKSKLFNDKEGKPIIRIRDISNSYTPTYTTEEYNDLYIVTKNDILVGMDGEFKAHIWGGKDSLLNQRVLRIRPKDNNSIAYSYFSIKEPLRYLENSKVGTTVIHLGKKDIDNIKIVYPPNNLISKYRDIADNLINKICENKVEIMELSEIRDSLLPKLMSGEISLNNII